MTNSAKQSRIVFLFDVDNTLLDNDEIITQLRQFITACLGEENDRKYWTIFEEIRKELGYADYLGTLQRFRREMPHDPQLISISAFLLSYPFENRLFPGVLDLLEEVQKIGKAVILTDGDVVFQPLKIHRSGLFDAVNGQVLIYVHKELEMSDVVKRYPADHYVLVDDKVRLLTAIKAILGDRVTTVFPRQGHYAFASDVATYPTPDYTIEAIGDLRALLPAILSGKP